MGFVVLTTMAGIAITAFWLVIGWRAMRAHERLAMAAENFIAQQHVRLQRELEGSLKSPSDQN